MIPTGIRWLRNVARSRFKLLRATNGGTYLLAALLILSACLGYLYNDALVQLQSIKATVNAQGHANTSSNSSSTMARLIASVVGNVPIPVTGPQPNCFVPPEPGNCGGKLFRYYFHWGVGNCFRYVYSGCGASGNNFRNKRTCMRTCWHQNYNIYCKLPMDRGQCGSWVVRYYYDKERNHCFPFWFSGCGGNLNSFRSAQECRAVCIPD